MAVLLRTVDLEAHALEPIARHSALALRPARAEQPALLHATGIHPVAIAIPLAAAGWFVEVVWYAFGGVRPRWRSPSLLSSA